MLILKVYWIDIWQGELHDFKLVPINWDTIRYAMHFKSQLWAQPTLGL